MPGHRKGHEKQGRIGWRSEGPGHPRGQTVYQPHRFSALPVHLTTWELLKRTGACLTPDQLNWNRWDLGLSSSFF